MRKTAFALILIFILSLALPGLAAKPAVPEATWADVRAQLDKGATTVTILNSMTVPEGETLESDGTLTVEGGGNTLTGGLTVARGTVVFKDTILCGANGVETSDGGAALTVKDGAVAVLSGRSGATGGRAGQFGAAGGDGVALAGDGCGLILRGQAYASGGVGRERGGCGARVDGCGASVLLTDNASLIGGTGTNEGGSGLYAPACAKVSVSGMAQLAGGGGLYESGSGLLSVPCEKCEKIAPIAIGDTAVLVGGAGITGGAGARIVRAKAGETADVTVSGTSMFFGGSGATAGAALALDGASAVIEGSPVLYGGSYSETDAEPLQREGGSIEGEENFVSMAAAKVETDPSAAIPSLVHTTLEQLDENARFIAKESALSADEMVTSLDGVKVVKDYVSQMNVNGRDYKTTLWNATYEKKLSFRERLMQAEDGVRLVLIARESQEFLTLESTPAALEKYAELGVTEIALTMNAPIYYERVFSLTGLIEAMQEYGTEKISRVMVGTADDCVIFRTAEDNTWDYQETLMPEIMK